MIISMINIIFIIKTSCDYQLKPFEYNEALYIIFLTSQTREQDEHIYTHRCEDEKK
jgi:hypothetical protein